MLLLNTNLQRSEIISERMYTQIACYIRQENCKGSRSWEIALLISGQSVGMHFGVVRLVEFVSVAFLQFLVFVKHLSTITNFNFYRFNVLRILINQQCFIFNLNPCCCYIETAPTIV
jgi:hypothetical protein